MTIVCGNFISLFSIAQGHCPLPDLSPMTSHPSAPHTPPDLIHTAIRYDRPTSRPAALGMNLALGTKAKLAITNGLGRINKKLRASSFSSGKAEMYL